MLARDMGALVEQVSRERILSQTEIPEPPPLTNQRTCQNPIPNSRLAASTRVGIALMSIGAAGLTLSSILAQALPFDAQSRDTLMALIVTGSVLYVPGIVLTVKVTK